MITPTDITGHYVNALVASAAVEAWCQANYGKSLKIFVGFDTRNPPGSKDAPFALLQTGIAQEGDEQSALSYVLAADWGIVEEGTTTTGNVVELTGPKKIDALGRLIMEAFRASSVNVVMSSWTYTVEAVEFFPMMLANMQITLNVPQLIGGAVTL